MSDRRGAQPVRGYRPGDHVEASGRRSGSGRACERCGCNLSRYTLSADSFATHCAPCQRALRDEAALEAPPFAAEYTVDELDAYDPLPTPRRRPTHPPCTDCAEPVGDPRSKRCLTCENKRRAAGRACKCGGTKKRASDKYCATCRGTYCLHGHLRVVYGYQDPKGHWHCRRCGAAADARYRARRDEALRRKAA